MADIVYDLRQCFEGREARLFYDMKSYVQVMYIPGEIYLHEWG